MDTLTEKPSATQEGDALGETERLPREGSKEFESRCAEALRKIADKYAWTAQQGGIILRRNPLKLQPYQDYVFNRISKAEYGFRYRDRAGRPKTWYPDAQTVITSALEEGEDDFGFVVAERIAFLPGQPEITHDEDGCRVLNLWRPPVWKLRDGMPEPGPFLDHLAYLLDSDQAAISHVLDFLAHMLQRPQERVGHALLITSEAKGIGKSTLGTIMRRLVGERNSRVAQTKDLKSQFDGWLVGNLLIQVDEVYEAGNWDLANKLKPLITERTVSVNVKYGPQMEVENYARFIMFSNHAAPLSIEDGDRRYFVFGSQAQPKEDSYYEALNRYIEGADGMNEIYSFLMQRDLLSFNPHRRPPMTASKQAVIETSGNPLRTYVVEAVESGHFHREFGGQEFTLDELQRQLHKDSYGSHAKNLKELGEALKAAGVSQIRRTANGSKRRFYVLPSRGLPEEEISDF